MVVESTSLGLSETIAGAVLYMYFVAFSGGMGLLTAAWIGYKFYNRSQTKMNGSRQKNQKRMG